MFDSKVKDCAWENWEKWVSSTLTHFTLYCQRRCICKWTLGAETNEFLLHQPSEATPHHLVFVADPQITDPHSYPSQPWPISSWVVAITDDYLIRGYGALQRQLKPDSVFFLGDLFDGGREWKTRPGTGFVDPKWGIGRSNKEKELVGQWHNKYGEDFWLREYKRFGDIFFDKWSDGGDAPGAWQRGRKLVASLPGNHDLGFGAQVQIPVRDRFSAFFGDLNRVDVVGNHTIVSVDSVSLSADTSKYKHSHDLKPIYGPVNEFLDEVKVLKRRAVQRELNIWHGGEQFQRHKHIVEDLSKSVPDSLPTLNLESRGPEFPTILLTHVPLYRAPGTPCGKFRERSPPLKPPKGQTEPVIPDFGNAIKVNAGYQYQNVLSEEDSVKLVKSVGNIVHVFSGDDHDYCDIVHEEDKGNVREITVKSMSMAMGIPTPGFLMVSLYNPVNDKGETISGKPGQTLQTHLCLLPNQIHTYMKYITFGIATIVILTVRAYLVPVLNLTPFALGPEVAEPGVVLPTFKHKVEPPDSPAFKAQSEYFSRQSSTSSRELSSSSSTNGSSGGGRWTAKKAKKGWSRDYDGPRINLYDDFHESGKDWKRGKERKALGIVGSEMWTSIWRVVWMAMMFWVFLAKTG